MASHPGTPACIIHATLTYLRCSRRALQGMVNCCRTGGTAKLTDSLLGEVSSPHQPSILSACIIQPHHILPCLLHSFHSLRSLLPRRYVNTALIGPNSEWGYRPPHVQPHDPPPTFLRGGAASQQLHLHGSRQCGPYPSINCTCEADFGSLGMHA